MEKQSNSWLEETLKSWMSEIVPFGNFEKYITFGFDGDTNNGTTAVRATFWTGSNYYRIVATKTYLGCTANSRKSLAGEYHARGNDLPDGAFSREIWDHIKNAILRYEMEKLSPQAHAVPDQGTEVASTPIPA